MAGFGDEIQLFRGPTGATNLGSGGTGSYGDSFEIQEGR